MIGGQFIAAAGREVASFTAGAVVVQVARRADADVVAHEATPGRPIAILIETGAVAIKVAVAASQGAVTRWCRKCGAVSRCVAIGALAVDARIAPRIANTLAADGLAILTGRSSE